VDWSTAHPAVANPLVVGEGPLSIAWIMSPPGVGSGGHQNIFRFIRYLERAGHTVRIYLYSATVTHTADTVKKMLASSTSYSSVTAKIGDYSDAGVAEGTDAIFATGWETAYASFLDSSPARRLYFVQDFEPSFYPPGSDFALAENTFRFGFTGITAGGWLASRLSTEYGMDTHAYHLSADRSHYNRTNDAKRAEIFFYARPGTPRRGFELGLMALDILAHERPDCVINFAGWDVARFRVPFPYRNLGLVPINELNALYNRCAAALVLSFTNMSLLPLELVAAGTIPVVNDADNNSMVTDNPFIEYADP
jgi:hypothetical protein